MRTHYLKVTVDDRFTSQEILRNKLIVYPCNAAGAEQTTVEFLSPLEGRELAAKATAEALDESCEGLRPYQNYHAGFISGYNAAIGRGEK